MAGFKLVYQTVDGEFEEAIVANYLTVEEAGQAAIEAAANKVKLEGRASIAAAGFSTRWQNAFRVDVHPSGSGRPSARAAAFIYHKIGYAGIFEDGGVIQGKPLLWVPMSTTPQKVGRFKTTPEAMVAAGVKLKSFEIRGKPFLGATIRTRKKDGPVGKITMSLLQRGGSAFNIDIPKSKRRPGGPVMITDIARPLQRRRPGVTRTVPLFAGVKSVTIPKKFSITQIVEKAASSLPQLYASFLKVD